MGEILQLRDDKSRADYFQSKWHKLMMEKVELEAENQRLRDVLAGFCTGSQGCEACKALERGNEAQNG